MRQSFFFGLSLLATLSVTACGGGNDSGSGSGSNGNVDGNDGDRTSLGDDGLQIDSNPDLKGNGADSQASPCASKGCGEGQRCVVEGVKAVCEEETCATLDCASQGSFVCIEKEGVASCKDISCASLLDCGEAEYCDTETNRCEGSVCISGATQCGADGSVRICNGNGSALSRQAICASTHDGFTSACVEGSAGQDSGCTCVDDWDCPAFTRCESTSRNDGAFAIESGQPRVGVCVGTGQKPSCALPPAPFSADNTQIEIQWGSENTNTSNPNATAGTPYAGYPQVVMTPLVANLDDDNGDGFIDEKDIPEIIFVAFGVQNNESTKFKEDGILRAISGGGPNKGKDLFATCGTNEYWHRDTGYNDASNEGCADSEAFLDATGGLAVADLDYDGIPEIIGIHENKPDSVVIYNNRGEVQSLNTTASLSAQVEGANPYPTIANFDGEGFAEIIVGASVLSLGYDVDEKLVITSRLTGGQAEGAGKGQGPVSCVADLNDDGRPEIIGGPSVYTADGSGGLSRLYQVKDTNGTELSNGNDGFCAVADILGADLSAAPGPDNPLDGKPDIALVIKGELYIADGATGQTRFKLTLGGEGGGAPNIDDFDGDGFPEIGTAGKTSYKVFDLQQSTGSEGICPDWSNALNSNTGANSNPARSPGGSCTSGCAADTICNETTQQCVCLHNGWFSSSEDDSSQVTGSSVFDFNGDGAAEVVYHDECRFRIFDGTSGEVLLSELSESRTRVEYPIVADVDRDGNAEIVFATTTESFACSTATGAVRNDLNAGIEVWGDLSDLWVPARTIWNQHAYSVTGITESGQVPLVAPNFWGDFNGRPYNTYRSNPRNFGVAPDLIVKELQYASPGASCGELGDQLDLIVAIENIGDLLVGPDAEISFMGSWGDETETLKNASDQDIKIKLGTSLEPKKTIYLTLPDSYSPSGNNRAVLPDSITARVDANSIETECNDENYGEDNNSRTTLIKPISPRPDLSVVGLAAACSVANDVKVDVEIANNGSRAVTDPVVAIFSGDPTSGGIEIKRTTYDGEVKADASATLTIDNIKIAQGRQTKLYAVVDPDNRIAECSDGDNSKSAAPLQCGTIVR